MKVIWKYPLVITDSQAVLIPYGAQFLSVIELEGKPTLYALVDPEPSRLIDRTEVLIKGTGHPIDEALPESHVFLGTVKIPGVNLIWHIFVEKDRIKA